MVKWLRKKVLFTPRKDEALIQNSNYTGPMKKDFDAVKVVSDLNSILKRFRRTRIAFPQATQLKPLKLATPPQPPKTGTG